MICETCTTLNDKLAAAIRDNDPQRQRVMQALLSGHIKHQHSGQAVKVEEDTVIWPCGMAWKVK
jgi:protein-arginine kinase activator protein McsA